jgi:hypothetical protein
VLDDVRTAVAEAFSEVHRAFGRDFDVSELNDVITHLHSAGEGIPGFLDYLDPERLHQVTVF